MPAVAAGRDGAARWRRSRTSASGAGSTPAHRLRRQHQPRAEDAGRRAAVLAEALADEDDPEVVHRARRADGRRGPPGRPHHRRPARAVADRARRGAACATSSTSHASSTRRVERVAAPGRASARSRVEVARAAATASRVHRRPPPARVGARQPARERGEVLATPGRRSRCGSASTGQWVDLVVARPRHRHPGRATSTASSSASTASTRAAAARPAAPGSAWPSCATWPPTTAARCRSSSQEGEGSTFTLRMPAAPTSTAGRRRPQAEVSARDARCQPTVLVVEDEESFVEALTVGLAREGFRVAGRPRRRRGARRVRRRASPTSCCST